MKICSLPLLILLLVALWTESQGKSFRSPNVKCCSKDMFIQKKIPASIIKSYRNTPSSCLNKAVIVELPKRTVCVDPTTDWFQKYLKQEKSNNTFM